VAQGSQGQLGDIVMKFSPFTYVWVAVFAAIVVLGASVARAQPAGARPAKSESSAPVRTGKERLGNKWSDEQRVDNCKVPPDKRGTKPRPDSCPPELTH
jgi:hypothetical protein